MLATANLYQMENTMPRDGAGTYSVPFPDFVPGTIIDQAQVDANNADIASAITNSIARNGETVPTQALPMGGRNHTNVSDATAANQYASAAQVQKSSITWCGTTAGTGGAYTATMVPAFTGSYVAGMRVQFRVHATNTTSATLNVSGLGAKAIQWFRLGVLADLPAGMLQIGSVVEVCYPDVATDKWVLLTPAAYAPGWHEVAFSESLSVQTQVVLALPAQFARFRLEWRDTAPSDDVDLYFRYSTNGGVSADTSNYVSTMGWYRAITATPISDYSIYNYGRLTPVLAASFVSSGEYTFGREPPTIGYGRGFGFRVDQGEMSISITGRSEIATAATHVIMGAVGSTLRVHHIRLLGSIV